MNPEAVARRTLEYREKESGETGQLVVEVFAPYVLEYGKVDLVAPAGSAACVIKFSGIATDYYDDEVFGMDSLQALTMATDIEGKLKHLSETHDLFFNDGSPYFD